MSAVSGIGVRVEEEGEVEGGVLKTRGIRGGALYLLQLTLLRNLLTYQYLLVVGTCTQNMYRLRSTYLPS